MKFMNTKRFLSTALAGAMALSLAVPAFAEGEEEGETPPAQEEEEETGDPNTVVITGTYTDVEIAVTVPDTGSVQINPYGLEVNLGDSANTKISGQQIVTAPLAIVNNSGMNLSVGAEVTGKITDGSTMKLATASTTSLTGSAANAKTAFVYFQMGSAVGKSGAVDDIAKEYAEWNPEYSAETDIIVGTKAVKKDNIVTLTAATVNEEDSSKMDVSAGGVAMFRLSGDCIANPTTQWAETDGFTTTVVFSFSVAAE